MAFLFDTVCKPAFAFFIISVIICVITMILNYRKVGLPDLFSQMFTIIGCTLMIMGFCNFYEELGWVFATFFVLCSGSWAYATSEEIFINFLN